MKTILSILAVFCCATACALAAGTELVPVKIHINAHDDVYRLNALGINIEELRDGYVEARISPGKMTELRQLGWNVEQREPEQANPKVVSWYHNYAKLTAKLDSVHTQYPGLTKKISIGTSVQGREIWALCVAKNPDSVANRAEVRFAGNIHGNEPQGVEMCIGMIDSLTRAYATVPEIADLVNNREIWFVPMFNPDGNTANQRYNANGTDLNRNFPVPDGSIGGDGTYTIDQETQEMMDWENGKRFVDGCMYHSGALIVNYQWDYADSVTAPLPDSRLINQVSYGYASRNSAIFNTPSPNFQYGIVFGWYWYPAPGSLQDWSYFVNSCVDLTIEISLSQGGGDSLQLPQIWAQNRDAMLYLIKQAGWGVQGVVSDSLTGQPINRAQLDVGGISKPVWSDSLAGDYHRMLMTGNYSLTFSKPGYASKTFSNVRVKLDSVSNLNVKLSPILLSGTVTDSATALPIAGAVVEVVGVKRDTTDAAGHYSIQAPQGTYTVNCAATGYGGKSVASYALNGLATLNFQLGGLNQFGHEAHDTIDIPDNGAWITDSIYVGESVSITDYRVYVNITHTYKGDLAVRLFHPDGTDSMRLHQRSGGAADNIIGWYPDSIKPADSLRWAAFDGLNARGWWKLRIKDFAPSYTGRLNGWALQIFSTQTGVGSQPVEKPLPIETRLFSSRPNPLRERVTVSYQLQRPGWARLRVYNVSGQLVRTLDEGYHSAGYYAVTWDGRDGRGALVTAGVYFCKLDAGVSTHTNKLVVVR